jgi:lipopolysaccharide transport system ATP-binding protein
MSNTIIQVENLSKRYIISHQQEGRGYKTLRDAISDGTKALGQKLLKRANHKASDPTHEEFWALKDVSFEIKQGDRVGIIGRNGAGKSTLLKILSRITEPSRGRIAIKGRVASLLEVGTGFHPELTGRENIYLNGAILGMSRVEIKKKFDEIVAFAEVERFLDTPVKRYSSGMYVRLAFAVAAHLEPEILIVDEVLAVGDASFQRKCLGKMGEVSQAGRTVLFVSHNMGAIRSLCTSGIWLQDGKLVMAGTALSLTDKYLTSTFDRASSIIDLRTLQRSYSTGDSLRLITLEINHGNPILHGEPLSIRVEYETYRDIDGVAIGIGFSSMEGYRLMSIDSDLMQPPKDVQAHRRGVVEMKVDNFLLQPGLYLIDIGARFGGVGTLDYIPSCAQVEILPGPQTPGFIIRSDGGVRIPARWRWLEPCSTSSI